jgi:signal transduction histidine kinase/ligand-binding sensor domain-containing protein
VEFERIDLQAKEGNSADQIASLLATPDGGLWIGFQAGGANLMKDGQITGYGESDGLPKGQVYGFTRDSEGAVWVAADGGLARLEGSRWRHIGQDWGYRGKSASAVFTDRAGTLWVASEDTIVFLPPGRRSFEDTGEHLDGSVVYNIAEGPDGRLWLAADKLGVKTIAVQGHGGPQWGPSYDGYGVFFDRAGSLWIPGLRRSGAFDGLMYHLRFPERLEAKADLDLDRGVETFGKDDGLTGRGRRMLEDREGNIWVGTHNGLDRFRPTNVLATGIHFATLASGHQGDDWAGISVGPKRDTLVHIPGKADIEYSFGSWISAAHRDANGVLWLGNLEKLWRAANGELTSIALPAETHGFRVQAITNSAAGLWVSISQSGVFLRKNNAWIPFGGVSALPKQSPITLMSDSSGRVWFGYFGDGGVAVLDGHNVTTISPRDGLQIGTVMATQEGAGHVWIGGDRGLALFDGKRARPLIGDRGQTFRGTSGIVETAAGDLWIFAIAGIIHVQRDEVQRAIRESRYAMHCEVFDSLDGLPGTAFRDDRLPTEVRTSDGRLWFTATNGLAQVDPSHLFRNTVAPPVLVRYLDSGGRVYKLSPNLTLPAHTASVHVAYTALSYSVPERVKFRYRLDGVDKDWQDADSRREAFYTNLGPGQYRFRVIACNNDGVWNETGAVTSFRIAAAFSQTLWFTGLCYLTGLALLWGLYRFRLQQATVEVQIRLEGRVAERERIARELHDTLLQSVQGLMLGLQVVDELLPSGKAKEQLERSLDRVDQAIVESRSAVQGLRFSTGMGKDLAEALRTIASEFAGDGQPTFHLIVEGEARDLDAVLRDEIYRIACEGLRNAFNHSRASRIELELAYNKHLFRLRIRDDGDGIPLEMLKAGRSGHYGLSGMRERARQTGAKLDIWSSAGKGTEIDLSFPGSIAYGKLARRFRWRLFPGKVG